MKKIQNAEPSKDYLYTGRLESALDDLRMCVHFLDVIENNYKWKWVVHSLTNSLYLLSLHIIKHRSPLNGISDKALKKYLKEKEDGKLTRGEFFDKVYHHQYKRTISFPQATDVVAKVIPISCSTLDLPQQIINDEEIRCAKYLRQFYRDEFEHMKMDGHSFQVSHLPKYCIHALSFVKKIVKSDSFLMSAFDIREDTLSVITLLRSKLEKEERKYL
ncbi:MAG: hypothetical protein IIB00_09710 [candidate division Zixibacteria bacterium]|nr:hypothetical protein [candidate division Zixibacteria bacterium]